MSRYDQLKETALRAHVVAELAPCLSGHELVVQCDVAHWLREIIMYDHGCDVASWPFGTCRLFIVVDHAAELLKDELESRGKWLASMVQ